MRAGVLFSHPACLEHDPTLLAPGHPEAPGRLRALESELRRREWPGWDFREAPPAGEEQLELVHTAAHVRGIAELCARGGGALDADTPVIAESFRAAQHAAGAACAMVRSLLAGEAPIAFCAIRPPGHHAEPGRAMGFCLFNNVAIAAELAIRELGARRVFILDWDVHHGNGTNEIFHRSKEVLFASLHQSPLYPGTGPLGDVGEGEGEGFSINLPVPPGSGEDDWLSLVQHVVMPAAREFEPELVLVSTGFDAHRADPLANCMLESGSFAQLAIHVRELAEGLGVPVGVVLEGGYDLTALAESVVATLESLSNGAGPPRQLERDSLSERAATVIGRYWRL
jgi:acetoin utilization deacetylase AcuC-like enzyme